ncbi:DUF3857 domain-containing protein [Chryseosolibacter indicus]|uniref:DUF3857 domain-containing protein n=1 Tax=Chryseosolibacter indicus TaxID=2782351 RepID=A0ABS5VTJ7_9BACT|nr:DUF3857 domain-containing protein [Chryseosolibacter indicus]MBT1704733.1 DUF3857 domain-containing protein [Chryseosolibacter indicus]
MLKRSISIIAIIVIAFNAFITNAADRAEELRKEMWKTSDKDFHVKEVPQKWLNKSAVIIAKLHRFEYRKLPVLSILQDKQYNHFRIMLLDKNAVNKYSELSYPASGGSTYVYTGFKVIKPSGKEIIVDEKSAVKMERKGGDGKVAYYKIAVPNLEPGDIIDYYICQESEQKVYSPVYFFDPFIYNLPQEYPLMKQKLQFKIQRKCYINLRSVNGAPELKMVDDKENDEQYYSLEDGDREGIADIKWLYPNRDVPTIKFRASFAMGSERHRENTFLGEQGKVKNKAGSEEIVDFVNVVPYEYPTKSVSKYVKKNFKRVKDPFIVSTEAYNYLRNDMLDVSQVRLLNDDDEFEYSKREFLSMFTSFLKNKKIPHDIVICVRRDISSLDDVVLENELDYLVRVKKGNDFLYFANPDIFRTAGSIPSLYQGTDAYVIDGLLSSSKRVAKRITLPSTVADDNSVKTTLTLKTTDMTNVIMAVNTVFKGVSKLNAQPQFLDIFDAIEEDKSRKYPEVDIKTVVYTNKEYKKYQAAGESYLKDKEKNRLESLKKSLEREYGFSIKDLSNLKILQTGRYEDKPELITSFDFSTDQLIKKTGPNYIIDIGKLIEQQTKIEAEENQRAFGVYFDYPRSFRYQIVFEVPAGYQVQGLEKLNQKVENSTGGFVSTVKEEGGKVIIETYKHYEKYIVSKDQWPSIVSFLNAANDFTEQKILLKKKTDSLGKVN